MVTAQARFTKADLKRAAGGVVAAGLSVARIEIDPSGKIVIIPGAPKTQQRDSDEWADLE